MKYLVIESKCLEDTYPANSHTKARTIIKSDQIDNIEKKYIVRDQRSHYILIKFYLPKI